MLYSSYPATGQSSSDGLEWHSKGAGSNNISLLFLPVFSVLSQFSPSSLPLLLPVFLPLLLFSLALLSFHIRPDWGTLLMFMFSFPACHCTPVRLEV